MKKFLRYALVRRRCRWHSPAARRAADRAASRASRRDEILQELRQIRQLLQKQGQPQPQPQEEPPTQGQDETSSGVSMLGVKNAPLTIVEFTDYQCPFCQRFHVTAFPEIKKNYIDTGKVRFFSSDMPLDFHPNAMRAARPRAAPTSRASSGSCATSWARTRTSSTWSTSLGFAADLKMDTGASAPAWTAEKYKNACRTTCSRR